ncbi:MAG: MFS transporter, partial [Acetobacteraceae bacterium]|nr:MFS transporter [Acetobacteraceae bacterium]
MEQLDGTVLATALPSMARTFNVDPLRMNVALTSYLLSLAVFIPASGKAADRFGSRTVFRGAIALFTLGSILCAQAPSLPFLVGARM